MVMMMKAQIKKPKKELKNFILLPIRFASRTFTCWAATREWEIYWSTF